MSAHTQAVIAQVCIVLGALGLVAAVSLLLWLAWRLVTPIRLAPSEPEEQSVRAAWPRSFFLLRKARADG